MCKLVKKYSRRAARRAWLAALLAVCALAAPLNAARAAGQTLDFSAPLTTRWLYATDETVNLTPAAHGDRIYLPLAAGVLVALDVPAGQLLWKADMGGAISAAPAADERGVYVATEATTGAPAQATTDASGPQAFYRATGALRALSQKSGVTLWMRTLPGPIRGALATDGDQLYAGTADGRVYAFNRETGEVRWQQQYNAPFASQPVATAGRLFIGSEDGSLLLLDEGTGRPLWRYQTRGALRGPVALANQLALFGSADGYVYALDEQTGRLRWRTRTGAGVQSVAATPHGLLVASLDNFVYLLSYRRGVRVWKRLLAGRIAAQPLTSAEGALFAPLGGDACVVLALHDGKTLNTLLVGEDGNTAATPVLAADTLLITTRHGLMAFAPPTTAAQRPAN
ncbi:MAG TPA: PQQ-binding-like beta-propeller repeat protein [Pyrinomonadaceae bacterium]